MSTDLIPQREWIAGRRFIGRRKVRLGDVRPTQVLRLDALTRYTQDVSDDDTTDAGLANRMAWVVRSTVIDVITPATMGETLEFATFCSATGKRWAERRITVQGDAGAHYEVATLWISVDAASGRPAALTDDFFVIYGEATAGRTVKARLTHPAPPPEAQHFAWPLRRVDYDIFGHVNNAAYWALVEEHSLDGFADPDTPMPYRAKMEYGAGVSVQPSIGIAAHENDDARHLWWCGEGGSVLASASVRALGSGVYGGKQ